jgi:CHRD domain
MLKVLAAVAFLLGALAYAEPAEANDLFKATLTGGEEAPPVGPVDTDTGGKATLSLNKSETEIEFQLRVDDGERITQAHIHCGDVGVNGPIVVFLAGLNEAGYDVDGKWVGNATITDSSIVNTSCGATVAALAESMRGGHTYANVHSFDHPGGVVRGQIRPTHD